MVCWLFDQPFDIPLVIDFNNSIGFRILHFFNPNRSICIVVQLKIGTNKGVCIRNNSRAVEQWLSTHDSVSCSQCFKLTEDMCLCPLAFCQFLKLINHFIPKKDRVSQNKTNVVDWLIDKLDNIAYQSTDNGHSCHSEHGFWGGECMWS